ncbi:GEVED domain-containing protein [Thalassovita taeanensis]|uniref:Conserved repeat domain-containing protein n=1 Tax=Thalassovita taeanensis TaxID=657014 RepID=A0A1H9EDP1_9RHOB|nr:GEVED domain-containing protein [Thalassovita taeanensis]SEQ23759.1 conserved repeat domain-containing protein [Thalassovita taeanensis]
MTLRVSIARPTKRRFLGAISTTLALAAAPLAAETCSVSPDFVNWLTPGTTGGGGDQSANIRWGTASTGITISGPEFVNGVAETSIIRFQELTEGQGTFSVAFNSPVVHDFNVFFGNLGRTTADARGSGIVGDFGITTSDGAALSNVGVSLSPLDNAGYFQTFLSDTQGFATTTLSGTGPDGLPLDGRVWIHDAVLDFGNGGADQAYGMVDLAYGAPIAVSTTSTTIDTFTFRQVGIGVGPTGTLGIQARLRSCITALLDDLTATPIDGQTGGSSASVLGNDALNTATVSSGLTGNVTLAVVNGASPAVGSVTLNTNTGEIDVAAGTSAGTYTIEYSITDRPVDGTAANTDTAFATVVVTAPPGNIILADDDDFSATPINGLLGGAAGNAFSGDTLNGTQVNANEVTATVLTPATPREPGDPVPELTLSGFSEGIVTVPGNTPAGLYTIVYELCEDAAPTNCATATITISVINGIGLDFGDAPLTYLTPFHNVGAVPTVYLGAVPPDTEAFEQPNAGATGDDIADVDDEEGVVFPLLTQGVVTTVSINVTGDGFLQGWIDFDGDGLFADALNERIATDLKDDGTGDDTLAGDGVIDVDVAVPDDATLNLTYARFRYSTTAGLDAQIFAGDGEVEDYSLVIAAADLVDRGDAPVSYGDPRHVVVPDIYLGAREPDTETTIYGGTNADGDDNAGIDDEDGIASMPIFTAGSSSSVTVQTHETLSLQLELPLPPLGLTGITNLQMWIDFNGDGTFDPSEQVAADYRDGGNGDTDGTFNNSISFNVAVPASAPDQTTFARLRWSTTSGLAADSFTGLSLDGEVEDYLVTIVNPNPPLVCDAGFYMVATETGTNLPALTRLSTSFDGTNYNLGQSPFPPSDPGTYLVTGWGFNELDNYIYGVGQSPRNLWRIDGNGELSVAADISGLALQSPDTTTDILPNGILIYKSGTTNSLYQLLDISDPSNPVALGVLDAGPGAPYGRDMAYNPRDGLIYFYDPSRNLYAFDPNGGAPGPITTQLIQPTIPLPTGIFAMDFDSVWFDAQGYLYAFDNQSRQVWALDVGVDGDRPASWDLIEIEGQVNNITYQGNDGASCRGNGPFAPAAPQGGVSGNVYIDANANDLRDGGETNLGAGIAVTVYSDNGTPTDLNDDTLIATTDTLADGTYAFADLSAGTYRVEVDTTDPDLPAGSAIGTSNPLIGVVVADGTVTTDQDFGFDPQESDLSITKTALSVATGLPVTSAAEGDVIDWVISVTNNGPGSPSGVRVSEKIPSGFQYVSDDAPATGDTYDSATGIWFVDEILSGATETLRIRTTVLGSGNTTNVAEIVASSLSDTDSDPSTGIRTDDLSDGIADDDEASYTVTLDAGTRKISGRVFLDNGAGGGTAHDAAVNGTETGTQNAILELYDANGALLASPAIAADGTWSYALADDNSGALTLTVQPGTGLRSISEATAGLPGLTNADPHDGTFTFSPATATDYSGLDVGLILRAQLSQDQSATIAAGQIANLRHDYRAFSTGTVDFAIEQTDSRPDGAFAATLYRDADCDGTPETAITAPVAVVAGDRICLISRVTANSGIGPGSSLTYQLVARTAYDGTSVTGTAINTDRVTAALAGGRLELAKTVRNITQNTPEGASNGGGVGDVLEYRIYLTNPSAQMATDVIVYDKTPAYTRLAAPIPSPVVLGTGLTCTVGVPASNAAGYAGPLRWDCTGTYAPGDAGSVSFRVQIAP